MRAMTHLFGLYICFLQIFSCTAGAPKDGVCVRSCPNRPVGGGKVYGVALSDPVAYKNCKQGSELDPITYRFFIYEDMSGLNSSSSSSTTSANDAQFPARIGKAGIAITPMVDGFNRIDTPSKDWCTDSCGYAEVSFIPTCYEQNVSIGLVATGMIYDKEGPPKTKFSITFE